jgi:hypothetical protein
MKEINIPVFRTNTLILEFPHWQQTTMNLLSLCELQDLAHTSPQGASGMDEH